MEVLINIFIFLLVVFLYLHINTQLKRSEDLEISEMDYIDNENLQEVCELKQPILFEYKTVCPDHFHETTLDSLFQHGSQEIKVKDSAEYFNENENPDYLYLPYQSANSLFISDTKNRYFSENNQEYLDDTGVSGKMEENDTYLKPPLTINKKYDFVIGSRNVVLPLRYHSRSRQYLCVNSGKIHVKMTPWKSSKYLSAKKDYENYDFRSPLNPWHIQPEFENEMSKLRFLEFDVYSGYVLYIPPYWWFSIRFSDSNDNLLTTFSYDTPISFLTNLPNYTMYYLQQSNITRVLKKEEKVAEKPDDVEQSKKEDSEKEEIVGES